MIHAPARRGKTESKLDQAVVLYFPPEEIGEAKGARCGKCMMFVSGHCTVVEGSINGERGVCGLYVHGKHSGPNMHGTMPKNVAGYVENGPTHCDSCEYFLRDQSACQKVAGRIEAQGCCNAWEAAEEDEEEEEDASKE